MCENQINFKMSEMCLKYWNLCASKKWWSPNFPRWPLKNHQDGRVYGAERKAYTPKKTWTSLQWSSGIFLDTQMESQILQYVTQNSGQDRWSKLDLQGIQFPMCSNPGTLEIESLDIRKKMPKDFIFRKLQFCRQGPLVYLFHPNQFLQRSLKKRT